MRIDGFQNIPAILHVLRSGRSAHSSTPAEETNDSSSVNLSSFGSVLQSIQRDSAAQLKIREGKVNEIAEAVQSGDMKMNLEQLAVKLVDLQIIDFKR